MDSENPAAADLSVVVPAVNDAEMLAHTLSALFAQNGDVELQILVPARTGDAARRLVADRFPSATLLPVPPGTTIPAMRRIAFDAAKAPVVAVIEDHVTVPPDWAARLVALVSESRPVVGGWLENEATARLSDRAAYLCEYGHMLRPVPSGEHSWVTGNNVAYHRSVLDRFSDVVAEEQWENRLHDAIRDSGVPLVVQADLIAGHRMLYRSGWEYAGQRYLYSRAYAGMRAAGQGSARSLALGLGALLLPPVLLFRIVKNGWGASVSRTDLVMSLPLLTLFVSAWSLGEVVGALAGPGDALGRVR